MSLKVTKDRTNDVLKAMAGLTKNHVLVGIPDSTPERDDGEMSNAQLGYIHEFGSPAQNIPARPFLVPGVNDAKSAVAKQMEAGIKKTLTGDKSAADKALHAAGLTAENAAKAKINSNVPPPLSPRTLAQRRARGVTRENTLVDTGQLRNSITYVIRPKGK